jgi:HD-GYP domain-containing protein (c-di-GMP phosphodiesterase class II)
MAGVVPKISIDQLIDIVNNGGTVRTGVDIFNKQGRLLLEKDVLVSEAAPLLNVKKIGVGMIPIVNANAGGIWDKEGKAIEIAKPIPKKPAPVSEIDRKLDEIIEIKKTASEKYKNAKSCIKKALESIQENGGRFEFDPIEDTVSELFDFVSKNDTAFSYLTREIFSYDDYLYNHSINVCAIGTVVMKKFNDSFSAMVNSRLNNSSPSGSAPSGAQAFKCFMTDELQDISIGYFMHDMGKVLIDKNILNKKGKLTASEFETVKQHSISNGARLLAKNSLVNPYVCKISRFHHSRLFNDEERCYPNEINPVDIPLYVKVCKLADIYDAMTSKRSYQDALNPVVVVSDIFHKYAEKDNLLQFILHSFVKAVGIYPPGSIISLTNGQLAYVFDSQGPALIPITDINGSTLKAKQDILLLNKSPDDHGLKIDRRKPPLDPLAAHKILPDYLKKSLNLDASA